EPDRAASRKASRSDASDRKQCPTMEGPQGPKEEGTAMNTARDRVRRQIRACENLIAQRAARRDGAMPAIARFIDDGGPSRPEGGEKAIEKRQAGV
ncbi:hypothetical protein, partial [Actinomadura luteofluorescens]